MQCDASVFVYICQDTTFFCHVEEDNVAENSCC
jgi:hypothetical protein